MNSYVKYYGGLKVNNLKLDTNIVNSLSEAKEQLKSRTASTVLYNNFADGNIDALYFTPHSIFDSNICSVYKKESSKLYYDFVCSLKGEIGFKDYNIVNNKFYDYLSIIAVPQSDGTYEYELYYYRDENDEIQPVKAKWDRWSICNIEETDLTETEHIYTKTSYTWILGLNLESESLTQNLSITPWDTLGKYPKVSMGQKNYISGTTRCLLGSIEEVKENQSCQYTERINLGSIGNELEKLEKWKEFCADGELKLLKDTKGNSWIVQITESTSNEIDVKSYNQPTMISFSWSEVQDLKDMSIVIIGG